VNFLFKPKELIFNPASVRYFFIFIIAFLFSGSGVLAQERNNNVQTDSTRTSPSKTPQAVTDSASADANKSDTIKVVPKGDIETTINYSAKDSIRASVDGKMIWLYGDAKIVYGDIELEAEEITIDYGNNTLTANGRRDSLGQRVGYPIFKNGAELYETKDIIYNFKTRRARISEVVTAQGEGFLASDAAFKNEKNEILSINNSYTTCNLEHPHFRIRSTKTKAIPDDKIVAGPFYVEFNDIPLPAGFLFGMFPAKQESTSGIIFPSFGEEKRRGFNIRGGGYFFDISDYVKLALTGDIYTKGGHAVYANSSYIKRYAYSGTVNFAYSKNPDNDDKIETDNTTTDFRLSWSHSPQSKGTGRFAASVNAATATYNKNNNLMYGTSGDMYTSSLNNITSKLSSNVSYSKRFSGTPFSMGLNVSHSQDLQTREVDLQLPTLSLNMTNIYPFQSKTGAGGTGPLDNFSLSYTMNASNHITNNLGRIPEDAATDSIAEFSLNNFGRFIENGKKGVRHSIPLSTSFKALRFFTLSPSFNYEEKWYDEKIKWSYDSLNGEFINNGMTSGFTRVANYSTSLALTTRLYGMYLVKNPNKKVKAIRHVINPNISFNYTPDFTKNKEYFFEATDKTDRKLYRSYHEGSVYGGSSTGNSSSIGFGIGNNLEMKVKSEKDSVAKKVMLLNNLSISSSYNLLADSFNLSNISFSANTNILDNLINMNLSATLDPYSIVPDPEDLSREIRVDNLAWRRGQAGRITSATLNLSTNLNPKGRSKQTSSREKIAKSNLPEQEKEFLIANPDVYVDFEIPWNLNLGFNARYTHSLNSDPKFVQTLQASGDLSLSEKWKVTYTTGYDFENSAFTQTNIGISRDLHCWTMNLNWVPFGRFQSYNFTIAVKASMLQDLKMERRKPWFDNL
jgi:hypothetical protein